MTSTEEYYSPCSTASSIYEWSLLTLYSFIAVFVIHGLALFTSACFLAFGCLTATGICMVFLIIARLAAAVMSLVCYGGLIYAYEEEEECGALTTLVLVYLVIVTVALGLTALGLVWYLFCCILALCWASKMVSTREFERDVPVGGGFDIFQRGRL